MEFSLSEGQQAVQRLAAEVFTRAAPVERVAAVEATEDRFDRDLWQALAGSGLLGVGVPEAYGGLGLGCVELVLAATEQGRCVAPVPYVATSCAAMALAAFGSRAQQDRWLPAIAAGEAVVAVAPAQCTAGVNRDRHGRLTGEVIGVPWAHLADRVLLATGDGLALLDPADPAVGRRRGESTSREVVADLELSGAPAEPVGGPGASGWLLQRWRTAWAGVQAGVTAAALRLTAEYTSARRQFGKPLSSFQGVALRAADAFVDSRAIGDAALQAAWCLDAGVDATLAVLTAAWWAADGGQRCVHATQHLHGGMGADVTYPVHRYYLWGVQIGLLVGGGSRLLEELGRALVTRPDAGDAVVLPA